MCEQLENKKHWDLIKGMKVFYLKKPTSVCINLRLRARIVNYDKKSDEAGLVWHCQKSWLWTFHTHRAPRCEDLFMTFKIITGGQEQIKPNC